MNKVFQYLMPIELHQKLRQYAFDRELSMAQVVTLALIEYFKKNGDKK